jgi:hypothetical protein
VPGADDIASAWLNLATGIDTNCAIAAAAREEPSRESYDDCESDEGVSHVG